MKKLIAAILAVALCAVPFAGCKEGDDGLTKIELNEVTHSVFYAPMYVAIEKGYFEENGLKISLTNGGGADKVMTAVLSNSAQIGLMGPESSLYIIISKDTHLKHEKALGIILGGFFDTEVNYNRLSMISSF